MLIQLPGNVRIFFFLVLFGMQWPAQASTQLDHAAATIELTTETGTRAPVDVKLPYSWDSALGGVSGKAHFVIKFPADPNGPQQALFIRRIGNSFELTVNGELLAKAGIHGDPYTDSSLRPRLFVIPPRLLRADNDVAITIGATSGRNAGMGLVYAGTVDEMRDLYSEAFRWRNDAYRFILVISVVLGGFAFLLWWRQREDLYLYYALSELLWAVHLAGIQFETLPVPWLWWIILNYSCYAISSGFICKFSLTLIGKHSGWIKRLYDFQLWLSAPVVAFALLANRPGLASLWFGLTILLGSVVAIMVIRHAFRRSSVEQRVLAVAVGITSAAALRDMVVFRILPGYGGFPWLVFAWATLGISMAWIIAERMRKSTHEIASMNQTLSRRLAEREAELSTVFSRQANAERQQAILEERQRLTRDMHDGLGSQLLGALHLAQNPAATRDALTQQLRETLDHLKLTVDAMQDTEGDIASLLGALRYRLGPRLEAAGVQLAWSVHPLPAIAGWTLQQSRDLQMILFEAFSNLIAHAGATHATLHASHDVDRQHIRIALHDNGRGFDTAASGGGHGHGHGHGHGLVNMQTRAARIGAQLHVESSADGGTATALMLSLGGNRP